MFKSFSLVEIIGVITIIAIASIMISVIGTDMYSRYTTTVEVNNMVSRLEYARSAAVTFGAPVTICPSKDKKHCSKDWHQPLIVFIDKNRDQRVNGRDKLLKTFPKLTHEAKFTWHGLRSHDYLVLEPNAVDDANAGHFRYVHKPSKGKYTKHIYINRLGQVKVRSVQQ